MPTPVKKKAPATKAATPADPAAAKSRKFVADLMLDPCAHAACTAEAWGKFMGEVDLALVMEGIVKQAKEVVNGDTARIETMLYGQAVTLQTMFTNLARRAAAQDQLKQYQVHMTLALKAQAQCRTTLEALAEIKNPRPVAFVKQANIAHGPQQVNNGPDQDGGGTRQPSPAQEKKPGTPNELLEVDNGQAWMVTGTPSAAGATDPSMATVG